MNSGGKKSDLKLNKSVKMRKPNSYIYKYIYTVRSVVTVPLGSEDRVTDPEALG